MKENSPLSSPYFVGREQELREIRRALDDPKTNIVQVTGLGGIGKTSLVLEATRALQQKDLFSGGIVWIDCQRDNTLPKILATIIQVCDIPSDSSKNNSQLRDDVYRYLRRLATLLIFDNFEFISQDDEVLSFIGRLPIRSKAIIVSRRNVLGQGIGGYPIKLAALDRREAREFFNERLSLSNISGLEKETFEKLYDWSGGVPLVLALVADSLERGGTQQDFKQQIQNLISSDDSSLSKDYSPINVLFDRISSGLTKDQIEFLEALSVFEHPVRIDVVSSILLNLKTSTNRISQDLKRLSFITEIGNQVSFHPVVRSFFREQIPQNRYHSLQQRMVAYYSEFTRNSNLELNSLDKEWLNIEHSINTAYQLNLWAEFIVLVIYISQYLSLRGLSENLIKWTNQAIEASKHIGDNRARLILLETLGSQYLRDGEIQKANEIFEQGLEFSVQEGDQGSEGINLYWLGIVNRDRGNLSDAINFTKRALDISRRIGHTELESAVLRSLGRIYRATGDFNTAIEFFEHSLELSRRLADRSAESASLRTLGEIHSDIGNNLDAIRFYERALQISREVGNLEEESEILGNLGNTYSFLGNKDLSLKYYEQALEFFRETGNRYREAITIGNIGNVYSDLGENKQAINYYTRALEIYREVGDLAGESTSYSNLGNAYRVQGDLEKSLELYMRALEITRGIGNKNIEAGIFAQIGTLYAELGGQENDSEKLGNAIMFFKRALEQITVEQSPNEYAIIHNTLGNIYARMSTREDKLTDIALDHYKEAQKVHSRESNPLQWASLQNNFGNLYAGRILGNQKENQTQAINHFRNALTIYSFEGNPSEWLQTSFSLANTLSNMDKWSEAKDVAGNILQMLQNTAIDSETSAVISWYERLGQLAQTNKDFIFAARIYTEAAQRLKLIIENSSANVVDSILSLRKQIDEKVIELKKVLGDEQFVIIWAESQGVLNPALAQLLQSARSLMSEEQYTEAITHFTSALDVLTEMKLNNDVKRQKATVYFLKGYCLRKIGVWGDALSHQENAFHLFEEVRDYIGEAHAFLEMGHLYEIMNNYEDSRLHYMDAYRLYRRANDLKGMASASENLGRLEYRVRLFAQAAKDLEEAQKLYVTLGDHSKAAALDADLESVKASLAYLPNNEGSSR